jgi:hypothetical protein
MVGSGHRFPQVEGRGEVDHGAGNGRDQQAVLPRDGPGVESDGMFDDAGLGTAASCALGGEVDLVGPADAARQAPDDGRRLVREHELGPPQRCRSPHPEGVPPVVIEFGPSSGVDVLAAADAVQGARFRTAT